MNRAKCLELKMIVETNGTLKNLDFGLGLLMRTPSTPFVMEREFDIKRNCCLFAAIGIMPNRVQEDLLQFFLI
jgi:hypothetical protein